MRAIERRITALETQVDDDDDCRQFILLLAAGRSDDDITALQTDDLIVQRMPGETIDDLSDRAWALTGPSAGWTLMALYRDEDAAASDRAGLPSGPQGTPTRGD